MDGQERVFPVNALAFHPVYGTFASGGTVLAAAADVALQKQAGADCRLPACVSSG